MSESEPIRSALERVERERSFHDERFAAHPGRNRLLGAATGLMTLNALALAYQTVRPFCPGATVLDYGCAQGEASLILRRYGATCVRGIDISPVAVGQAEDNARRSGVSGVTFEVMNAEHLEFMSSTFDVAFGIGILHHLDLSQACSEIARVLKPMGCGTFLEPLGHNPVINLVRRLTPRSRTEDEHPLKMHDLRVISRHFRSVEVQYVNLTTLLATPFAKVPGSAGAQSLLANVDRAAFAALPWVGRFAWNVVLTVREPLPNVT